MADKITVLFNKYDRLTARAYKLESLIKTHSRAASDYRRRCNMGAAESERKQAEAYRDQLRGVNADLIALDNELDNAIEQEAERSAERCAGII